jgi:hypothetical protein
MVIWGGHGKLDLGRVELVGGEPVDRGLIVMPATGRVAIDWSLPEPSTGAERPYRLLHVQGLAAVVLKGPGPPPDHLDLLPGSYSLVVEQDQVQPLTFEIESGREVRVTSGPAPARR